MSDQWFRVHYRNGKSEAVLGQAELNRVLARKVPAVIHHESALIFECQECGTRGPWQDEWITYPIWNANKERQRAKDGEAIFCSRQCFVAQTGGLDLPHWLDVHREPRTIEANQELNKARWDEQARKRQTVAHRSVPLPEPWKGPGWCRWCALIIIDQTGKRAGKQNKLRHWHPDCKEEWLLHSDRVVQTRAIAKRDGLQCWDCKAKGHWSHEPKPSIWRGQDNRWDYDRWVYAKDQPEAAPGVLLGAATPIYWTHDFEVDHDTPLWAVRHLPDEERRPFYGLRNLRLRCPPCHKAKTAREAADRARERSLELAQLKLI